MQHKKCLYLEMRFISREMYICFVMTFVEGKCTLYNLMTCDTYLQKLIDHVGFRDNFCEERSEKRCAHKFTYNVRNALRQTRTVCDDPTSWSSICDDPLVVLIFNLWWSWWRPDLQLGVSAILKQRLKYECVMFATQRDGCKMANTFQHLVKAWNSSI